MINDRINATVVPTAIRSTTLTVPTPTNPVMATPVAFMVTVLTAVGVGVGFTVTAAG
jgi:hypothetical protein